MTNNLLEDKSLWYKYKSMVWPDESEQTHSAHSIVRTLRAIHNQGELAYLSVPITSGKVLYDEILKTTISSSSRNFITGPANSVEKYNEVPKFKDIIKKVIEINYIKGHQSLGNLQKRINKPILFPADLYPRGEKWEQRHFQALWLTLIGEKSTELHMNEGWEYSNGAVEEFTHAYQLKLGVPEGCFGKDFSPFYNTKEGEEESRERMKKIIVYDSKGNPLSIKKGINSIEKVLPWIKDRSFNVENLENSRNLLEWTYEMIEKGFYQ